jgi:YD repeat-containing protein
MYQMTNWSSFSSGGGARVTTWNYDPYRGWLVSKNYPDSTGLAQGVGPSYTYTPGGRLATRAWARSGTSGPITTTYAYDNSGSLSNVNYSDGVTAAISYSRDRMGRQTSVTQGGTTTTTLAYNLASQLLGESWSGGPLSSFIVTNIFDQFMRRTNLSATYETVLLTSATYGYDAASRLATVADGNGNTAAYSYLANSPLVGQITFASNSVTKMTTTKTWDNLNRLTGISSTPSASYTLPASFTYAYNSVNQRTQNTLADGSYWQYGYDSLGQVTNGCKYFSTGTNVAGQQFDYTFDTIGNRTQTKAGGDYMGANLRLANYTNNTLNQITSRDVPPYADIMGARQPIAIRNISGNR